MTVQQGVVTLAEQSELLVVVVTAQRCLIDLSVVTATFAEVAR